MWVIVFYVLPIGMVIIANLGVTRNGWRLLTYICLGILNALTLALGLWLVSLPYLLRVLRAPAELGLQSLNLRGYGLALTATATFGFACLLTPLRRFLTRWLSIDPGSPVHATALVFVVYLATTSLGLLLSDQRLLLAGLETASLEPQVLVFGQTLFALLALAGAGLGIRRNLRQTLLRLDLRRPTLQQLGRALGMIIAFLVLDWSVSLLWRQFWPANYEAVTRGSEHLFAHFASPGGALVLGLSAGIGEEALFRGALQARFHIPLTALVFALGHVQYTLSPAIAQIVVIGLALGWLREKTNTTTCIVVHSGYNFLNVLLMPYLT